MKANWKRPLSTARPQDLLDDVTVTIPVRIDSPDRSRNLRLITGYLLDQFECSLVIAEEGESSRPLLEGWEDRFRHINCSPRSDGLFWKARLLNVATEHASTPLILSYDADVIVPAVQLTTAAERLRAGVADMVYPFDGACIDLPANVSRVLEKDWNWDRLAPSLGVLRTHPTCAGAITCVGGALMMSHEKFVACGMENERFVGWGGEDDERHRRLIGLGMKVLRTDGWIYHLHHRVDQSTPLEQEQYFANLAECSRIFDMNREQLETEVRRGLHIED